VSGATNRLALLEVGSWKKLDILQDAGVGATEKIRCGGRGLFQQWPPAGHRLSRRLGAALDLKQQRLLTQFKEHESNIDGVAVTFSSERPLAGLCFSRWSDRGFV